MRFVKSEIFLPFDRHCPNLIVAATKGTNKLLCVSLITNDSAVHQGK
jgi:hypothetical protein